MWVGTESLSFGMKKSSRYPQIGEVSIDNIAVIRVNRVTVLSTIQQVV